MKEDMEYQPHQDQAIREAVSRQARKRPSMPADLNRRVLARMNQPSHTLRHKNIWIAAACIAAAAILILTLWEDPLPNPSPSMGRVTNSQKSVNITQTSPNGDSNLSSNHIADEPTTSPSPVKKQKVKPMSEKPAEEDLLSLSQTPPKDEDIIIVDNTIDEQSNLSAPIEEIAESPSDPHALTPENMDRMIAQMAAYYQVEGLELNCSNNDDLSNGTMYVLPDDENIDIIARLYATLLHFDTSAPNIQLDCTHEQFFFCMASEKDGKTTEDCWIAERRRGRIYLYRTRSTEDEPFSLACFFDYVAKRDRKHNNYS
jgi:hypothetical protein